MAVEISIPVSLSDKWQSMADILARTSGFAAALIMRVGSSDIEVFVSSKSARNPYVAGEKSQLNTGLYCEAVMKSQLPLYVGNALKDPDWKYNPDISLGMTCYFGIVVKWPNGSPFGTVCVLDTQEKRLDPDCEKLLKLMREVIEADLKRLSENHEKLQESSEMLHEIEGRYAAIFRQAAIGIACVGLDGEWLEVNDRLCEIVGYSSEELMECTFQDITHPDDLEPDVKKARQVLNGEIPTYSMEKRYLHKEGHVVWVILTASLVRHSDGTPHYFVSVVENVTEKKFLQREIEQSQKLEAMGRLVGGMAHEFNNKLSAITGNLFLAAKRPESYKAYVKDAERLCFQASEMIESLLSYARKAPSDKSLVSLRAFLKEVFKSFQVVVPENIHLIVEVSDTPMLMRGNATQIQQIMVNLINNAVDAVQTVNHPEVVVRLTEFKPCQDFLRQHSSLGASALARITVEDNGVGMTKSELDKIFDPFYTTKPVGKGTGLGLAMVASLVEQHGGVIDVESTVGAGSSFQIYLPILDEQELPIASFGGSLAFAPGQGQTILVVDDNESVLKVTGEVLEALGYNVLVARDGRQALSVYAADNRISGVLTDVIMPIMGGLELYNRLVAIDGNAKVLFMTGHDSHDDVASVDVPVLSKPIAVADLAQALQKLFHE